MGPGSVCSSPSPSSRPGLLLPPPSGPALGNCGPAVPKLLAVWLEAVALSAEIGCGLVHPFVTVHDGGDNNWAAAASAPGWATTEVPLHLCEEGRCFRIALGWLPRGGGTR